MLAENSLNPFTNPKKQSIPPSIDLVAFSHLRWNFVWQRPNHLMTRFARTRRVFFVEEPLFDTNQDCMVVSKSPEGVYIVVPHLRSQANLQHRMQTLISDLFASYEIELFTLWYWTPMAVPYTRHLLPVATIYDCMDELASFAGAPQQLRGVELDLMSKADVVFTGGLSLFEARRYLHPNIHPFPSSIDRFHFAKARKMQLEPSDQQAIRHPRLGYFGVIDERFDSDLIRAVAEKRPDWNIVLVGPILKIDPACLPKNRNIHYLGKKAYEELPAYLSGWNVALLPFAKNEATRFISPTKTPEYLAAGKPVVSTSIADVVRPYGLMDFVYIADEPDEFIGAIEKALLRENDPQWLERVDQYLKGMSWDLTFAQMDDLIKSCLRKELPAERKMFVPHVLVEEDVNV